MNANYGIVPLPEKRVRGGKTARNEVLAARSLAWIDSYTGRATDTTEDETGRAEQA